MKGADGLVRRAIVRYRNFEEDGEGDLTALIETDPLAKDDIKDQELTIEPVDCEELIEH